MKNKTNQIHTVDVLASSIAREQLNITTLLKLKYKLSDSTKKKKKKKESKEREVKEEMGDKGTKEEEEEGRKGG